MQKLASTKLLVATKRQKVTEPQAPATEAATCESPLAFSASTCTVLYIVPQVKTSDVASGGLDYMRGFV